MIITLLEYPCVVTVVIAGAIVWRIWRKYVLRCRPPCVGETSKAEGETDYFKLTGVPPPKPLPDFNIDNALPRPYRPFRWKYHQTMCT